MRVLGIETSCDETAAAVLAETGDPARPWVVASNVVASQAAIHREWGGVVPELASRQHVRDICGVMEKALADAQVTLGPLSFDDFIKGWRTAWVKDPDGRIVEISQGYTDQENPPARTCIGR